MDKKKLLEILDLNEKWLELGILTVEELQALVEEYERNEDKHTEHYRHRAFRRYLDRKGTELNESTLRAIYRLGDSDPDKLFGSSVMGAIIRRDDCPIDLLEKSSHSDNKSLAKIALQQLVNRQGIQ